MKSLIMKLHAYIASSMIGMFDRIIFFLLDSDLWDDEHNELADSDDNINVK